MQHSGIDGEVNASYVTRLPRRVRAEDEWYPEPRETLDVIVAENDAPTDTGLVDQHGTPIMRLSGRGPLGFCR